MSDRKYDHLVTEIVGLPRQFFAQAADEVVVIDEEIANEIENKVHALADALSLKQRLQDVVKEWGIVEDLFELAVQKGNYRWAERLIHLYLSIARKNGLKDRVAYAYLKLGELADKQGKKANAVKQYNKSRIELEKALPHNDSYQPAIMKNELLQKLYTALKLVERPKPSPNKTPDAQVTKPDEFQWIESEEIDIAFQSVIAAQSVTPKEKGGRRPVRAERVWDEFKAQDYKAISLDDLEKRFANTRTPRKTAASTISWLNAAFEKLDVDLEIQSAPFKNDPQLSTTIYFFRRAVRYPIPQASR